MELFHRLDVSDWMEFFECIFPAKYYEDGYTFLISIDLKTSVGQITVFLN